MMLPHRRRTMIVTFLNTITTSNRRHYPKPISLFQLNPIANVKHSSQRTQSPLLNNNKNSFPPVMCHSLAAANQTRIAALDVWDLHVRAVKVAGR